MRHLQQTLPELPPLPRGFRDRELDALVHALSDHNWQLVSDSRRGRTGREGKKVRQGGEWKMEGQGRGRHG